MKKRKVNVRSEEEEGVENSGVTEEEEQEEEEEEEEGLDNSKATDDSIPVTKIKIPQKHSGNYKKYDELLKKFKKLSKVSKNSTSKSPLSTIDPQTALKIENELNKIIGNR